MPETFVLAVQETNFFYSFTLSFFVALTTLCDQIMDKRFESISAKVLLGVSAVTWVYGMVVCLYLFGRKVPLDQADEDEEEDSDSD
jgi:hypothetical protein